MLKREKDRDKHARYLKLKKPRYDPARVELRRQFLAERLLTYFLGERLDARNRSKFLSLVLRCPGMPKIRPGVMEDSMRHLAGPAFDRDALLHFAMRLSANAHRLKRGIPLVPWRGQEEYEWVVCRPVEVHPATKGRLLASIAVEFGSPAGTSASARWSPAYAGRLAGLAGYDILPPEGRTLRKFAHPRQLVGLQFWALAVPNPGGDGPELFGFTCTEFLRRANSATVDLRFRTESRLECPGGFPASHPCHRCIRGTESCPAATHRRTYVRRPCAACKRDAWSDPGSRGGRCLACEFKVK